MDGCSLKRLHENAYENTVNEAKRIKLTGAYWSLRETFPPQLYIGDVNFIV